MGLFCGKRCQDRKDARVMLKYQNRMERTDSRSAKGIAKYNAYAVGYYNGIDPNAAKWGAIGGMGKSAFNALGKGLGQNGAFNRRSFDNSSKTDDKTTTNDNNIYLLIGAMFFFFFMNKNKK